MNISHQEDKKNLRKTLTCIALATSFFFFPAFQRCNCRKWWNFAQQSSHLSTQMAQALFGEEVFPLQWVELGLGLLISLGKKCINFLLWQILSYSSQQVNRSKSRSENKITLRVQQRKQCYNQTWNWRVSNKSNRKKRSKFENWKWLGSGIFLMRQWLNWGSKQGANAINQGKSNLSFGWTLFVSSLKIGSREYRHNFNRFVFITDVYDC